MAIPTDFENLTDLQEETNPDGLFIAAESSNIGEPTKKINLKNAIDQIAQGQAHTGDSGVIGGTIHPIDITKNAVRGETAKSGTSVFRIFNALWRLINTVPFTPFPGGKINSDVTIDSWNLGERWIILSGNKYELARAYMSFIDDVQYPNSALLMEHYSNGSGDIKNSTYGIDIYNHVGAQTPFVIHQYSKNGPIIWLDNTDNAPAILINNTRNHTKNPSPPAPDKGEGDFLRFADDGVVKLKLDKDYSLFMYDKTLNVIGQNQTAMSVQTPIGVTGPTLETKRDNNTVGNHYTARNSLGQPVFGITTEGRIEYSVGNIQSAVGVSGSASPLPATPEFYMKIEIGGVAYLVPAYLAP